MSDSKKFEIKLYAGSGKMIKRWLSDTGYCMYSHSNMVSFVDVKTGKLNHVSGTVIITGREKHEESY